MTPTIMKHGLAWLTSVALAHSVLLAADLTVKLPAGFTTAMPVSLRGEKIGPPQTVKDRAISLPLKAYAPACFILQ